MKPHAFHPEAGDEYANAADYYAKIDPELGGRFYDEMEHLLLDIRRAPERFWRFDPPARRHLSKIFPYALVYVEQSDRIWVLAVMNLKRRPGYWKNRL